MTEKSNPNPTAHETVETPRLVRALRMCFYGGMRIRPGKTFTLLHPETEFSASGMEYVVPGGVDETAQAVEASPKQRGSAGVTLKHPSGRVSKGTLAPDAGI